MDYPIETYNKEKKIYYRYYNCVQKIGKVECTKYDSYEELLNKKKVCVTKYNTKEHTNGVFPAFKFNSVCFQIYNWVPLWFDNIILKYNLHKLLFIHVKND